MSELSASEARFRALVTATSDVVYRLSPDWELMYELDGRGFLKSTKEPIKGWRQLNVHPEDLDMVNMAIAHAIATKSMFELEHKVVRADGSKGWTISKAVPILDTNGEITEWFGAATDITARKEIELEKLRLSDDLATLNEEADATNEALKATNENLQFSQDRLNEVNVNLAQILDMLPASVVVIRGYDLIVEMINDSNLRYWNKTKEEVLGKPFLEILPDLINQPFAAQLRRVMETGEVIDVKESPVIFTEEDGSIRETYVDYTYQPLSDMHGKRTGVLVMSFEITESVRSKQMLEQYATELATANDNLQYSNQELAKSEARFKYLIQEAPVAIAVLHGRSLFIESANDKILEVWGKTSKIIGMPLSVGLPELHGQPFLGILDEVFTMGKAFYANEIPALLEHGGELKEIFFNVTYQPILDASGNTADILVVAVDVTQQVTSRRQVEQSEQHFRHLADLVPAKISNALPTGEVFFFNKQWLDFAGMDFENLRDFGYHQMMHPDEIPGFQLGLAAAAATGIPHVSEMRFKNTDGKYIWHLNIASPILDEQGNITMWVGSTTDIQALKEEEQRKSDFVSMLSHELKTPVTSIKGHVQLVLRNLEKDKEMIQSSKIKPSLSRIDRLLMQLTSLIGDMLDLTRIESGRLDLRRESFLLDALIAEVVEDFRLSHQQHQFHLSLEQGIQIRADRDKISQVLINLIANAVKYGPNSDVIEINSFSTNLEVLVSVKDYGIGIDERDQRKIFERFYRVEGQSEFYYSGFGIGLYLANSIVQYHGGKIALESVKEKGSTFTVHIPLN